jgi:hypothetical protein
MLCRHSSSPVKPSSASICNYCRCDSRETGVLHWHISLSYVHDVLARLICVGCEAAYDYVGLSCFEAHTVGLDVLVAKSSYHFQRTYPFYPNYIWA